MIGGSALFSTTILSSILQSCQTQERLTWTPQFLSTNQAQLVSALVDTLLPKTDTPGGLDMKVDILIDLFYAKVFDKDGQEGIKAEIDGFLAKSKEQFGKPFYQLEAEQKQAFLEEEEANSPKFARGVWGYTVEEQEPVGFYRGFKSLAIMGYCTAADIGQNQLKYDPIPGPYQGCIPLDEVGGVWTL